MDEQHVAYTQEMLCADVARELGARRVWLVLLGIGEVHEAVVRSVKDILMVHPLEGTPVRCVNLRELGAQARERGAALVADCTQTGVAGCAANRLGAHACLVGLGDSCVVGMSREGVRLLPELPALLDRLSGGGDQPAMKAWQARVDESRQSWHRASDAAQVVASYLRCHPRVAEVRYPGLRGDPSFEVAARTLVGGFGPFVDWRGMGEDGWQRVCCRADDARTQVMELEAALSSPLSS